MIPAYIGLHTFWDRNLAVYNVTLCICLVKVAPFIWILSYVFTTGTCATVTRLTGCNSSSENPRACFCSLHDVQGHFRDYTTSSPPHMIHRNPGRIHYPPTLKHYVINSVLQHVITALDILISQVLHNFLVSQELYHHFSYRTQTFTKTIRPSQSSHN